MSILFSYRSDTVDDWGFLLGVVLVFQPCLLSDQGPQTVKVDGWAEFLIASQMVISHTKLWAK